MVYSWSFCKVRMRPPEPPGGGLGWFSKDNCTQTRKSTMEVPPVPESTWSGLVILLIPGSRVHGDFFNCPLKLVTGGRFAKVPGPSAWATDQTVKSTMGLFGSFISSGLGEEGRPTYRSLLEWSFFQIGLKVGHREPWSPLSGHILRNSDKVPQRSLRFWFLLS